MIDWATCKKWKNSTFFYLKMTFPKVNEGLLEDAISEALLQLTKDYQSAAPSLSVSLSTLKHLAWCRTADALDKYRHECPLETYTYGDSSSDGYDSEEDHLIEEIAEAIPTYLSERQQLALQEKYKTLPQTQIDAMESAQIHEYYNHRRSDETLAANEGCTKIVIRADRHRAIKILKKIFNR